MGSMFHRKPFGSAATMGAAATTITLLLGIPHLVGRPAIRVSVVRLNGAKSMMHYRRPPGGQRRSYISVDGVDPIAASFSQLPTFKDVWSVCPHGFLQLNNITNEGSLFSLGRKSRHHNHHHRANKQLKEEVPGGGSHNRVTSDGRN
ncbi:hypothetical protein C1H46_025935 [Malus baccata]|uniref:Uncharacterized protein n=1 Tax=Malus baccata TaxID=106549 RepID=A0A540LPX6_MALBA|nr:hypothetical protein C1H46_025935 [Malus baccata]